MNQKQSKLKETGTGYLVNEAWAIVNELHRRINNLEPGSQKQKQLAYRMDLLSDSFKQVANKVLK